MSIVTVCAVPYEVMADYLRGDNPLNPCAVAAEAHARVWIISVISSPQCPINVFEAWGDGPVPLVERAVDRLPLVFDDIEPRADPSGDDVRDPRFVYFDEELALRVCEFVRLAHGDDPARRDLLLINCHAGVSRSGAIADFARAVTGVDYDAFTRANAQIVPNVFVRRALFAAWDKLGAAPSA